MVWSRQRKVGCCYFADHLAAPVEAPRLPFPYLFKRIFRFVLVGSKPRDDLSSFELELREEFCRHPFSVNNDPPHQRLARCLLIAVEHLR